MIMVHRIDTQWDRKAQFDVTLDGLVTIQKALDFIDRGRGENLLITLAVTSEYHKGAEVASWTSRTVEPTHKAVMSALLRYREKHLALGSGTEIDLRMDDDAMYNDLDREGIDSLYNSNGERY